MAHIKINDTTPRVQYVATAAQKVFTVPFEFFEDADIVVYEDSSSTPISSSLYSLTGAGVTGGGELTYVTGKTVGTIVTITRESSIKREVDFTDGGDWTANNVNDQLDKLTTFIQEVKDLYTRAVKLPVFSALSDINFPVPSAGKAILWNSAGDGLENSTDNFNDIVTNATAQATAAAASATAAGNSATAAGNSATAAAASASAAATSDTNAGNSASLAQQWANEAEDVEVTAGEYSAYHWAQKSAASALGIAAVVEDTSPELGGNLDVGLFDIISSDNNNIEITPNGTGAVVLKGISMPVADGTAGQVMQTDGAGNVSFADAAGGGLVLLGSYDIPAASTSVDIGAGLDLDVTIDDTYDVYKIFIIGWVQSNASQLVCRTSGNGGVTFDSTSGQYSRTNMYMVDNISGVTTASSASASSMSIATVLGGGAERCNAEITLYAPASTTYKKYLHFASGYEAGAGSQYYETGIQTRLTTSAVDALRIYPSSGQINGGSIHIYGVTKT